MRHDERKNEKRLANKKGLLSVRKNNKKNSNERKKTS